MRVGGPGSRCGATRARGERDETWQERAAVLLGRSPSRAPEWFWIAFLLALALRLLYVLGIDSSPLFAHPAVDSLTYGQHAGRLAAGNWLGRGEGPFWPPPLYPYFLGLVKLLFPQSFFQAARLFQALFGALTCALLYWIGRRVFQPLVAAALCGPLIFFDGELLPASLATFLDLAGLGLLLRSLQRPSPWGFLSAGLVFGLGVLAVPTVLSFVLAGAAWSWWDLRRRGLLPALHRAGIFLLGTAVVIAPVALRNYAIGGDTVLISYNAGINFYVGNNPDYDRTVNARPGLEWDNVVSMPRKAGIEQPSRWSRFFFARSWDYIRSQPLDYLGLLARKLFLFWHGDEIGRNQDIYFWRNYSSILAATLWKWGVAFPSGIAAPLALLGLLLALRHQGFSLPALFIAVYALSVVAFFPTARYRVPLLPLLLLFAAHGGHWIYACLRAHRFKRAGLALAVGVVFAGAANFRLAPMDMGGNAAIHYNLGMALAQDRQLDRAQRALEQAVLLDSTYWQAWLNLGVVLGTRGEMERAARAFERVAQEHPDQAKIWINLARARRALKEWPAALRAYQEALRANPEERMAYLELIGYHLEAGEVQQAEEVLEQAVSRLPRDENHFRHIYERARARAPTR